MARRGPDGTVLAAGSAPRWRFGGASRKGQQIQYVYNLGLRHAVDRAMYPIWVEVTVLLRARARYGVLGAADMDELSLIEQILTSQAAERAVLAGQVTTMAARTFLLYSASANLAPDIAAEVQARASAGNVAVRSGQDPGWSRYRHFSGLRRRTMVGYAALWLLAPIGGGVMLAHYGQGWAIGETIAVCSWIAAGLIAMHRRQRTARTTDSARRPIGWMMRHPVLTFAVFSYVLATMLVILPALLFGTALPALASLGIGAGLGVAITAAVWPSQLRYYAMFRERGDAAGRGEPGGAGDVA